MTTSANSHEPASGQEQIQPQSTTYSARASKHKWWMHPVMRYLLVLPIVAAGIGITLLGEYLLARYYFPGVSVLVAILCASLFLGIRPGLLALFLSCVTLIYLYLLPKHTFGWELLFQLLPLVVASLIIMLVIEQRESARQRALQAEQSLQIKAQELSEINEKLQCANQLKDFFVSIASHELRTPLTTIRGQAQLAQRRLKKHAAICPDEKIMREALSSIDEQSMRMAHLLNDLLDLTGLRSGKQKLVRKKCDLNEICSRHIREEQASSGRQIAVEIPPEPTWLWGDPTRLGQVVANLLSNALKYSPPESSVELKIEHSDKEVYLLIHNAGKCIPLEQQEKLFQPFYRTSDARASNVGGTGLGLAICKDIVERHGGHIGYEGGPGTGSLFSVILPLSSDCADDDDISCS